MQLSPEESLRVTFSFETLDRQAKVLADSEITESGNEMDVLNKSPVLKSFVQLIFRHQPLSRARGDAFILGSLVRETPTIRHMFEKLLLCYQRINYRGHWSDESI